MSSRVYTIKVTKFGKCSVCRRKVWNGNKIKYTFREEYDRYTCQHTG